MVYWYEISIIAWHYYWGNGYNPILRPYFRAIPALMIAATVSTSLLIKAGITIAILQFVESNILSPYIVGKSLRMHPVIIMLALLVGGEVAGIVGLLISVPVLAVIRTVIVHVRPLWKKRRCVMGRPSTYKSRGPSLFRELLVYFLNERTYIICLNMFYFFPFIIIHKYNLIAEKTLLFF